MEKLLKVFLFDYTKILILKKGSHPEHLTKRTDEQQTPLFQNILVTCLRYCTLQNAVYKTKTLNLP